MCQNPPRAILQCWLGMGQMNFEKSAALLLATNNQCDENKTTTAPTYKCLRQNKDKGKSAKTL